MTRVRLFLAILALVLSTHSTAWADHPSDQGRLQELVEALRMENGIPGISVAIARGSLLWDHRQQHPNRSLPARGPTGLAGVADSAKPAGEDDVGAIPQARQALPTTNGHRRSLGLSSVAKPHPDGRIPVHHLRQDQGRAAKGHVGGFPAVARVPVDDCPG
jgi:hypothetical protein